MEFGQVLFCLVIAAIWIGTVLYKANAAAEATQKEESFKRNNPEAYVRLKEMEHERELMAHDEKRMRHQNVQRGAGIFSDVFRAFWS